MPFRKDRPRPSAYPAAERSRDAARLGRTIVLSTGRADVMITAAEARELAADLIAAAAGRNRPAQRAATEGPTHADR